MSDQVQADGIAGSTSSRPCRASRGSPRQACGSSPRQGRAQWCGGRSLRVPPWSIPRGQRLLGIWRGPGRGSLPGEVVAVSLGEQAAEHRGGRGLVRAGLLEAPRLAANRVGPGVDMDAERPAGELLDVASGGFGHDCTITRNTDIRSTTRSTTVFESGFLAGRRLSESNRWPTHYERHGPSLWTHWLHRYHGNGTDGTHRAGTIHGPVPRPRPLRHAVLLTVRGKARPPGMAQCSRGMGNAAGRGVTGRSRSCLVSARAKRGRRPRRG